MPETLSCCAIKFVVVVIPRVETPETKTLPTTVSADVGVIVPIPRLPDIVTISSIFVIPLCEFNSKFPEVL